MTRKLSLCLVSLCIAAAGHLAGCASDPAGVSDPELTPDEVAALPDVAEPDHAGLAALLAAEPPETDAATYDTDEATVQTDASVDDDDDTGDTAGATDGGDAAGAAARSSLATTALLKSGLHPRASDALR
jgi:hypothetical protein